MQIIMGQWADEMREKAKRELAQIEKEGHRAETRKSVNDAQERTQRETAKEYEDLMKMVRDAEKKGNIKMTRRQSEDLDSNVNELIKLVKSANREGNIRILRRKSTESVKMWGAGSLVFGQKC